MKLSTLTIRLALTLVLLAGVALTFTGPPAAANDDNPPQSASNGRTFGNGILSTYATYYDADSSGGLSHEELLVLRRDRRSRQHRPEQLWDTNRDGTISAAEVVAARRSVRARIEQNRSLRFDDVDADRDGHLSEEEFLAINAVAALDDNTPGVGSDLFNNLDRDKDQRISKNEFLRKLDGITPVPTDSPPASHPRQNLSN